MNETAQILGIKKEYCADGTHTRYVINILRFKIAMNFKRKTDNGQNNKILWEKNGVYKKYKNSKKGLSINVTGNNNTVIVNSEIKFHNTKIIVHGENNTVIIKSSNKYIDNLLIKSFSDAAESDLNLPVLLKYSQMYFKQELEAYTKETEVMKSIMNLGRQTTDFDVRNFAYTRLIQRCDEFRKKFAK